MDIKETLRQYIKTKHLMDIHDRDFQYNTPLLSSGIIDSIGVLGLINFIESTFSIEFKPRELDRDRLETIDRIHDAILNKITPERRINEQQL